MANVVMINFCFDVPVKIVSTKLLLYSAFVALPQLPAVVRAMLGKASEPAWSEPLRLPQRWQNIAARAAILVTIGVTILEVSEDGINTAKWVSRSQAPLAGAWLVDGAATESRPTASPWRILAVSNWGVATIYRTDDSAEWVRLAERPETHQFTLKSREGQSLAIEATYTRLDDNHLSVNAQIDGRSTTLNLRRLRDQDFTLISRGFHWINDAPFSR